MNVEIRLAGNAASQAQGLVAELVAKGIDVRPGNDEDQDRDIGTLATDFTVSLVAGATYGVVHDLVRMWIAKRQLRETDVELGSDDETESTDDSDEE